MRHYDELIAFTSSTPLQIRGLTLDSSASLSRRVICFRTERRASRVARFPVSVAAPPAPATAAGAEAEEVRSTSDFVRLQARAAATGALCYVVFHARHCRACRALVPKFLTWAREQGVVAHVQVDSPGGRELASRLGVRAVPIVQVYQGAEGKIDQFVLSMARLQQLRANGVTTASTIASATAGDDHAALLER